jgi:hypothetical protein
MDGATGCHRGSLSLLERSHGLWRQMWLKPAAQVESTYKVTGFVSFARVPGKLPSALTDRIGNSAQAHAGLVKLRISYSDGDEGVLTISCHLDNTPDSVFEGVNVSKGFIDFYNAQAPVAGVDANRTLFHLLG